MDTMASTMIPLENTRRWPRLVSLCGKKRSSATKLARKGKPLKLVFPPVYRISSVTSWTIQNMRWPKPPVPNTSFASCESTVGDPFLKGMAWVMCARSDTPSTRKPRMMLMVTSTRRALGPSGGRKDPTPFEMASRPVSDDPPLAKALSKMKTVAPIKKLLPVWVPSGRAPAALTLALGRPVVAARTRPTTMSTTMVTTNR